ncbi:putative fibronectin/fibrinogen-binding protein [Treponema primitia ZAS-2]|uniref:Putative fibronectin/fibrinogen-binding protein n=1 Tax=Treponema primitia (strain ATCC BAA-887 / DSM 12427 / ZAS-2) TaxID=545694 RepID=F5YGV7_TREPZ|nr:NFACT family protein [Treponema primitia]AEF84781.1 putative fibronectin/fibrinogen-binding protein [Treponema primitia ZAS-2]
MSLNWKEINLILSELDLPGHQIQKVVQSAYDVLTLQIYGKGGAGTFLIAVTPGACRMHKTFRSVPKNDRPLRFAEFLKSRIVNGWIEEAEQLGDNRIVRLVIRQGKSRYRLYVRLWSNAANVVVTDETGAILDAMRRLPKRGELTGGQYEPEKVTVTSSAPDAKKVTVTDLKAPREYAVREFAPGSLAGVADDASFNEKIDAWYAEHGGALSLEALREQARRSYEGRMARLGASLERLREKEAEFGSAEKLREYGDIIMANIAAIRPGDAWLEAENFYAEPGSLIRIKLEPRKSPAAQGELYYEQYRKAKNGLADIKAELATGETELAALEQTLARLLEETNPLALHKLLRNKGGKPVAKADSKRPGLSFRRKDWLIIVGRDAAENDELLRRHVKGNDLWLHARDFPGSYVFIKQRSGKSVPLDILLDAGNLAIFYSKGRNNGEGDLFYTPVKFLRRVKNGPKGLVIPTQEKNLHIRVEEGRLKELEQCRIEKQ